MAIFPREGAPVPHSTERITLINETALPVAGVGPVGAKVMFIGEAPGEQEARTGIPFNGPSGKLLTDMMHACGIMRSDCYITNVVKVRPKDNDITPYLDLSKKVPYESAEYKRFVDMLRVEIEHVGPNVAVAVGGVALYALCGKKGILNWRGSVLESTLVPGLKVIPIVHPAAALRQYTLTHLISFDLKKVKKHADNSEIPADPREYILKPSMEDIIRYFERAEASPKEEPIGFDIEVASREVSCISFAHIENGRTVAISIPFTEYVKDYFPIYQEAFVWRKIAALLEDESRPKVAQNASFDTTFLYHKYGIRTRNLHDTMIGWSIAYPDFSKSLAMITSVLTDMPYYKEDGKAVIQQGNAMIRAAGSQMNFWLYSAKDSAVLVEAFPLLMRELERQKNVETYDAQRQLIEPFLFMTRRGLKMDKDGLVAAAKDAEAQLENLQKKLELVVGYKINAASPKQLADYFYVQKKVKAYKSLTTGNDSTDEMALKRLCRHTDPDVMLVAQILMKMRTLAKMKGTYFELVLDEDNRLRCSINIVGTKYGRVSSSKTIFGTGGNMQNQPREMKKYMSPDEGYVAYEVDLSQAENRVVAYVSGDQGMIDAFEQGRDIHKQTAGLIFGKPYEEISAAAGSAEIGGGRFSERDWGKRANHGLNYGMRERLAGLLWEVPEAEAKFVVEKYHRAYPAVREWHNRIEAEVRKSRSLTNLFGRKATFWDRVDHSTFLAAYAFIPQSTVADKINRHGIFPLYYDQENFSPAEFLLQVHDSIVFQVPISAGWQAHAAMLFRLKEHLETPLIVGPRELHIPADFKMLVGNLAKGQALEIVDCAWDLPLQLEDAYVKALEGQ